MKEQLQENNDAVNGLIFFFHNISTFSKFFVINYSDVNFRNYKPSVAYACSELVITSVIRYSATPILNTTNDILFFFTLLKNILRHRLLQGDPNSIQEWYVMYFWSGNEKKIQNIMKKSSIFKCSNVQN